MTMARKRVPAALRRDLLAAKERGTPVRIERHGLEDEEMYREALVVDVSPTLVLLNRISDRLDLDGFEVLRLADVTGVQTEWRTKRFLERALELKGQVRKSPAGPIDLAGMREAVTSANAAYPVIVVDCEEFMFGDPPVGRIREEVPRGFRLHWLTPEARWELDGTPYRWADVTRLEFGNEYERMLAMVADADGARPAEHPRDGIDPYDD
jgi:hypothetical protein